MLGLCYSVGVNEKVRNTGEPVPNFFLVVSFFSAFVFLQNLSPPPPNMGSAVFLNIGLTQTCIANDAHSFPQHGNLTKAPRERQGNAKLIVRNNVFMCTTLLKIEVMEYGKLGF